jgi:hypothetical protein
MIAGNVRSKRAARGQNCGRRGHPEGYLRRRLLTDLITDDATDCGTAQSTQRPTAQ